MSANDVIDWIESTGQVADKAPAPATFVVNLEGKLMVADRRSEHVACAGGADVLAAGEVFFRRQGTRILVTEISNYSSGYCPESVCWDAIAAALNHSGIEHPASFTSVVVFRLCTKCQSRNVVKDNWFHCDICDKELDRNWNF